MLIQNPTVHIPPEFKLIGPLFGQYRRMLRFLPWEYTVHLFGAAVAGTPTLIQWEMPLNDFYTLANELPPSKKSLANLIHLFYSCHAHQVKAGAARWGDKTPVNIRNLAKIDILFPEAKIIHLVRDGRDVVASIHELGWHSSLEKTCDAWLRNTAEISTYPQRANKEKFLEIRYESLVREPEMVLKALCQFIDLSYEAEMINFSQHRERLGYEAKEAHHAGLARPLNADSIGSWRKRLDASEQRYVMERLAPMLGQLGYEND